MSNAKAADAVKARLASMTPEQREAALLRMLRFMCSDDDGDWDPVRAERLRRACAKASDKRKAP